MAAEYVAETLGIDHIPGGTNLLVTGEAMSGIDSVVLDLLAEGLRDGDSVAVVSTGDSGEAVFEEFEGRHPDTDPSRLGVIDTQGEQRSESDHPSVRRVSSPSDLTGIGMQLSRLWSGLGAADDSTIRTGVIDVSTLLNYSEVETIFRFLHMVTGRIGTDGGLGLYVVYPGSHDKTDIQTLSNLFDGEVAIENRADGRYVRTRGIDAADGEWTPLG